MRKFKLLHLVIHQHTFFPMYEPISKSKVLRLSLYLSLPQPDFLTVYRLHVQINVQINTIGCFFLCFIFLMNAIDGSSYSTLVLERGPRFFFVILETVRRVFKMANAE